MPKKTNKLKKIEVSKASFAIPQMVDLFKQEAKASSEVRRNRAATNSRSDEFYHIYNGVEPFQNEGGRNKHGHHSLGVSVHEAIYLCQKCYWNFPVFKNIIDTMTEFSASPIFLRGGSSKSQEFFKALFRKVHLNNLTEMFFLEFYRSGNVFPYRFDSLVSDSDLRALNQTFGSKASKGAVLPAKYIILNPCDIFVGGNVVFSKNSFFKKLNPYEVEKLREQQTDEDKAFYNSLPPDIQKLISDSRGGLQVQVPLDPFYLSAIFYKRQSYEPMSVPLGFSVLKDINWKQEMKQIDMAVARTTQRAILHIQMGYLSKNDEYMYDQKAADATRELFTNESVGKVLVTDFATKVQFIIPDISDLLGPEKYQIVNEDIKQGLNYIIGGNDEKFANQYIQVNLFVERLKQARGVFLEEFLIPEIKRIALEMGFKNYPEPFFEDIDLKDNNEFNRIVVQLGQIGILSSFEVIQGLESGRLPSKEESIESQKEYKLLRDKGLYTPLIGGQKDDTSATPSGRPSGTKTKQKTKRKTKPMGGSEQYSISKIKDNLLLASQLNSTIEKKLKKLHKIKELSDEQKQIAQNIVEVIIANESNLDWNNKEIIEKYLENPADFNEDRVKDIENLAQEHQMTNYLASILYASTND